MSHFVNLGKMTPTVSLRETNRGGFVPSKGGTSYKCMIQLYDTNVSYNCSTNLRKRETLRNENFNFFFIPYPAST